MPRSKGTTSPNSSNALGQQLDLLNSGTLASVSTVTNPDALITMLRSSASQPVHMAAAVTLKDGKPVAQLAISFSINGDLASFMSELWKSNLPNTSQATSPKK